MPTARELLEQADALMRRNRKRGRDRNREGPPTLTDVLVDRNAALAPTVILPEAMRSQAEAAVANAPGADPIALDTLSEVPVLTDVVDVWPAGAPDRGPPVLTETEKTALDDALEADALAAAGPDNAADAKSHSFVGEATVEAAVNAARSKAGESESEETRAVATPSRGNDRVLVADWNDEASDRSALNERSREATAAVASSNVAIESATDATGKRGDGRRQSGSANQSPLEDEFILDIPPEDAASAVNDGHAQSPAAPVPPQRVLPGSPDWNAMAEEIRMQVLQRLDLFTDTGLRDQLGARLQPIVDRASADLVETINRELGELVRGYVAEAIEREIDSWRKRSN